ncbi:putative ubx domain protein [Erysiphe necator]|uniref:Putative ubx domain protein n=1 Tax=Uncinula necator TaxID=52586 RepID=A0A0B1P116_UNCNE|nr:putative ubx domain protein [Erysiphe necator]
MASNVVVIDTSFRRATIKVTPGTYLTDILEEACRKFNVQQTLYDLKYKTKSLDLFQTFRQSGLASGSKLELVLASRSSTPVSVALDLPAAYASLASNCRIVEKFSNDTTIWLILRKFESKFGDALNITARGATKDCSVMKDEGNKIFYEIPVLNVMGRELSNFEDFQKTLRQLGFNSGTCLIKLSFKKTNQLLEEAQQHIQDYFQVDCDLKTEDPELLTESFASLEKYHEDSTDVFSKEAITVSEASNQQISTLEGDKILLSDSDQNRSLEIFAPPSNQIPRAASIPHNDADFEPTITHAKLHQSRLQSDSQNKRLLSDIEKERVEKEKEDKVAKISEVSIKIRFPDQSTIVSTFSAEETGLNLYQFTTNLIEEEERPFKLTWHNKGPQIIPKDDKKLVRHLGFQNRMLVNFSWDGPKNDAAEKRPILKLKYANQAREVVHPIIPTSEEPDNIESLEKVDVGVQGKNQKKVGKWFKGLIKK